MRTKKIVYQIVLGFNIYSAVNAAEIPQWWTTRGVINTQQVNNDYAPVNAGQLKNVAYQTWVEVTNQVAALSNQLSAISDAQSAITNLQSKLFTLSAPSGLVFVQGGTVAGITVASFCIGQTEVTWGEWQTVQAWAVANGYDLSGVGTGCADSHPVQTVNWYDIVKWCNARSEKEDRTPAYTVGGAVYRSGNNDAPDINTSANGYRLPTDAEWEYAARGGTQSHGYTYSGGNDLNVLGWYYDNSGGAACGNTWPVGQKTANELGLYDMSGNLWEWCFDWHPSYVGSNRVGRGGCWWDFAYYCESGFRNCINPDHRGIDVGFRLACLPEKLDVAGTVKAMAFVGDGSGLSNLNANSISGKIAGLNLPTSGVWNAQGMTLTNVIVKGDGSGLTNLASGLVTESDPEVGANTANYLSKWNGSALVSGSIYDNGNISIGTTNISYGSKLNVNGRTYFKVPRATNAIPSAASNYSFCITDDIDTTLAIRALGAGVMHLCTDAGGRELRFGGGNFEETLTIKSGGNVSIGTPISWSKLYVAANDLDGIRVGHPNDPNLGIGLIKGTGDGASTTVYNGALESWCGIAFRSKIDGVVRHTFNTRNGDAYFGGNVGIGTASPTKKLHVAGSALVTGDASVQGVLRVQPRGGLGMGQFTGGPTP